MVWSLAETLSNHRDPWDEWPLLSTHLQLPLNKTLSTWHLWRPITPALTASHRDDLEAQHVFKTGLEVDWKHRQQRVHGKTPGDFNSGPGLKSRFWYYYGVRRSTPRCDEAQINGAEPIGWKGQFIVRETPSGFVPTYKWPGKWTFILFSWEGWKLPSTERSIWNMIVVEKYMYYVIDGQGTLRTTKQGL